MGLSGLEPPTSRLSGVRSNQLSYKPRYNELVHRFWRDWRKACFHVQVRQKLYKWRSHGVTKRSFGTPHWRMTSYFCAFLFNYFTSFAMQTHKASLYFVTGIRPIKPASHLCSCASTRITACRLLHCSLLSWRWWDSNSWPPACKAGALPTELHPHKILAATCSPISSPT